MTVDITIELLSQLKSVSSRSSYGSIFIIKHRHHRCILKLQTLKTGAHFDKVNKLYYDDRGKLVDDHIAIAKYFPKDTILYRFRHKESISKEQFEKEVDNQNFMSNYKLAPQIYEHGYVDIGSLNFAYIIMKKMDLSLKDYILKYGRRHLDMSIVYSKIEKMHSMGYCHGDLQPSNICFSFDHTGHIKCCRIIDWFFSEKTENTELFEYDFNRLRSIVKLL